MAKAPAAHKPPPYPELTVDSARRDLAELVNQAGYGGARFILTRRGKRIAALVSIDDLERLPAPAA